MKRSALHNRAMGYTRRAIDARNRGEDQQARHLFRKAFLLERRAAASDWPEPIRSVLFRSAATLAQDCGDLEECRRLANLGLTEMTPPEVRTEIRDLLESLPT